MLERIAAWGPDTCAYTSCISSNHVITVGSTCCCGQWGELVRMKCLQIWFGGVYPQRSVVFLNSANAENVLRVGMYTWFWCGIVGISRCNRSSRSRAALLGQCRMKFRTQTGLQQHVMSGLQRKDLVCTYMRQLYICNIAICTYSTGFGIVSQINLLQFNIFLKLF